MLVGFQSVHIDDMFPRHNLEMSDGCRLYIWKYHALVIFIHYTFAIVVFPVNNSAENASLWRQVLDFWVAQQSREQRFHSKVQEWKS